MIHAIHRRLRDATQTEHQRLEDRIDILGRVVSPEARRELVGRFHALHAGVETAIAPWLADLPGLEFADRRRTAWLVRDMAALDMPVPQASVAPVRAASVGEALGLMYVLEGSTLGGRLIRRELESTGQDLRGLSFLEPYGERVGERWRAFLDVLAAAMTTPQDADAAVAGAVAGFHYAELRLCGAPADA
jgi:heme oxygenase